MGSTVAALGWATACNGRRISITVSQEVFAKLQAKAVAQHRSINSVVASYINIGLAREKS